MAIYLFFHKIQITVAVPYSEVVRNKRVNARKALRRGLLSGRHSISIAHCYSIYKYLLGTSEG